MSEICTYYFQLNDEQRSNNEFYKAIWLGHEKSESISEALIPKYVGGGPVISLAKVFDNNQCKRWKVLLVDRDANAVYVYLTPRSGSFREEYLSTTHKSNRTVTSRLQLGTLVEVDFGHIPEVYCSNGHSKQNFYYFDSIHPGEMHKRRLCTVINAQAGSVQVVPITSKEPKSSNDKSIVEISFDSLSSLSGYNDPNIRSYAICNMVMTVASSRVLPPNASHNSPRTFRDVKYPSKLSSIDKRNLTESLSHSIGFGDYLSVKDKVSAYFIENRDLASENIRLQSQCDTQELDNQRLSEVESKYNVLFEIMVDWKRSLKDCSAEEAAADINSDVEDYRAILEE
jgi:uncharacterized protein YifN (PemK superfamily)